MKLIENMKASYAHIPYTWKHKMAVIKLEKQFTGRNTLRIILHDSDKIVGYALFPFLTVHQHKQIHRWLNQHHHFYNITHLSGATVKEMILDWESSRYTKPDKTETCREYCFSHRPQLFPYFKPWLDKWGI